VIPGAVADLEAADQAAAQELATLDGKLVTAQEGLATVEGNVTQLGADLAAEADAREQLAQDTAGTFTELDSRLDTFGDDPALEAMRQALSDAQTVADNAKDAAAAANTAASAASQAALEAAGIAASKGRVIVSETEPTGDDRTPSNIWIKPVPDDPDTEIEERAVTYVYLEATDEWQPTTSSELAQAAQNALDAREAAQQAQQRAETAISNAATAQAAAEAAETTAQHAQQTADGKNTVTSSTTAPVGSGKTKGDTWFRTDGSGAIIGQWSWTGAAWESQEVGSEVIANLDVGKLTSGSAAIREAVIDKLWVDGLVAKTGIFNQLYVAAGNLINDPNGLDPVMRSKIGGGRWSWDDTGKYWKIAEFPTNITQFNTYQAGGSVYDSNLLTPGAMYTIAFDVWIDAVLPNTAGRAAIYYRNFDGTTAFVGDGTEPGGDTAAASAPIPAKTWTRVTRYWRAPDTASSGGINFQIINSPGTTVGEIRIRNPFVGKQAASVMIEDGAVNAQKVNAESVAGAVGQF